MSLSLRIDLVVPRVFQKGCYYSRGGLFSHALTYLFGHSPLVVSELFLEES